MSIDLERIGGSRLNSDSEVWGLEQTIRELMWAGEAADQDQTFLCEEFFEIVCNFPQYFRAAVLGFYSHFKLYLAIFT